MPNDTVVSLASIVNAPVPEVVAVLEGLLEEARHGGVFGGGRLTVVQRDLLRRVD